MLPMFHLFIYFFCISGEFADVYKGILKTREGKQIVAVKVLRVSLSLSVKLNTVSKNLLVY